MNQRRPTIIWMSVALGMLAIVAGMFTVHLLSKHQQTANTSKPPSPSQADKQPPESMSTVSDAQKAFTPLGMSFSDEHDGVMYGLAGTDDEVARVTHDGGKSWTQTFALHGVITGIWATSSS